MLFCKCPEVIRGFILPILTNDGTVCHTEPGPLTVTSFQLPSQLSHYHSMIQT